MEFNLINSKDEEARLRRLKMLFGRNFMATIADKDGNVLFYPSMISNFSIDGSKIFISLYDLIEEDNVEEKIDKLMGDKFSKPKLKIILSRLDANKDEVYKVVYTKCKLKAYHGKNFTYKSSEPYQWYLEIEYGAKEIVKNENYNYVEADDNEVVKSILEKPVKKYTKEQSVEILKNSNKMLDEAMETVSKTSKLNDGQKQTIAKEIVKAKAENAKNAHKYYGASLDSIDFTRIAKSLKEEMNDTEDKLENKEGN